MNTVAAEITWLEMSTAMCERLGSRIQPSFCKRYRKDNINCHKCPQIEEMDRLAADLPPGPPVTVPIAESEDEPMTSKKTKICKDCGQDKKIIGRGLCGSCYHRHKDAGTLDELFPKLGATPRRNTKEEATASDTTRSCHEDVKGTSPDLDVTAGETAQHHDRVDQVVDMHNKRDCQAADDLSAFQTAEQVSARHHAAVEAFDSLRRENFQVLELCFRDRDYGLLLHLQEWAEQERRSLQDQVLFVLDNIVFERNQEFAHLVVPGEEAVNETSV